MARPGDILRDVMSAVPINMFRAFIEDDLCPLLDKLPSNVRSRLVDKLIPAQKRVKETARPLVLIDYDSHEESLENSVQTLLRQVNDDWHDGYEEQGNGAIQLSYNS